MQIIWLQEAVGLPWLDLVASTTTIMLAASPWPDFSRIAAAASTGDLSCLPYILAEWNWVFTTYYGWLINDQLLLWVNAVCGVFTLYFIAVFAKYSLRSRPSIAAHVVSIGIGLSSLHMVVVNQPQLQESFVAVAVIVTSTGVQELCAALMHLVVALMRLVLSVLSSDTSALDSGTYFCGTIFSHLLVPADTDSGSPVSVIYIGPLATVKLVIRTKDTSSMPLLLCLMGFVSSVTWTAYGAIRSDINVTLPNGIGVVFAALQLGLIACLPRGKTTISPILARRREGSRYEGWVDQNTGEFSSSAELLDVEEWAPPHVPKVLGAKSSVVERLLVDPLVDPDELA